MEFQVESVKVDITKDEKNVDFFVFIFPHKAVPVSLFFVIIKLPSKVIWLKIVDFVLLFQHCCEFEPQ
jgi:hypothetical protein